MIRTILAIARKEIRELLRQPLFLGLAFGVPLVMFVVFGYGITLDVRNMPFVVLDLDHSYLSREVVQRFSGEYFDFQGYVYDLSRAEQMLKQGRLRMVLFIPEDFSRNFYNNTGAELQVLIDGGYPYTASTIRGYAKAIVDALNEELLKERGLSVKAPLELRTRFFFNETLKSNNALVPGLLVVIMMVNPAVLVATAVAREKEFGTIYNIYSSPVRKIEFFAGKLLPYVVVSVVNLFVLVLLVYLIFGISPEGNVIDLVPSGVLYVVINILIGFVISTATRTIVSAQIITLIVTTIPAFLYSGLLIPVSHLGPEGRFMAHLYPCMYFMKVVQGVYLKKLTSGDLLGEFLSLMVYFMVVGLLAYRIFQKTER